MRLKTPHTPQERAVWWSLIKSQKTSLKKTNKQNPNHNKDVALKIMKSLIFSVKTIKQEDGGKNGINLELYKTLDYHVSYKRSDGCSSKVRVIGQSWSALDSPLHVKGEELLIQQSQAHPDRLKGRVHRAGPSGRQRWLAQGPCISTIYTHS